MASNDDTDDLYADLYGEGGADTGDVVDLGAKGNDDNDLIGFEDDQPQQAANGSTDAKSEKPASTGGSFIPAASGSASSDRSSVQTKGSFIPSVAGNSAMPGTDARDLSAYAYSGASGQQQVQHGIQTYNSGSNGMNEDRGNRNAMPHDLPEDGKMFIGGLNWETTEDSLRRYFSQFGEVAHCTIMRDNITGRSRGFAFLNYTDPKSVNTVVVREHYLDGKAIDPKRAIPKSQQHQHDLGGIGGHREPARNQKLFVGGLPLTITPESFRRFFEQYGTLLECTCMMDRETGAPRGFGFLTYQDDASIDTLMSSRPIVFEGKEVDIKRAQSKNDPQSLQIRRQQQRENPDMGNNMGMMGNPSQGNQFGGGAFNPWGGAGMMNPMMMGMMGGAGQQSGGFDPNAMAQMYQNMGWGGQNWNPMAWQQMMTNMAGGAGGKKGGMDTNPMMSMGGMPNMGMGMMGMGAMGGSMSPPINMAMSPSTSGAARSQRDTSAGPPAGDDNKDRDSSGPRGGTSGSSSSARYQRGPAGLPNKPRSEEPRDESRDYRERSPRPSSGRENDRSSYRRERSPDRRHESDRYDSYNSGSSNRNRY